MRSSFAPWRAAVALVITALIASGPAYALSDSEKALFGPVGVARGQVVRVSVYGIGNPDSAPWEFTVRFLNARGEVVKQSRLQEAPGLTGFADILIRDEENLPTDAFGRRTTRAEIVGFNPQPDPPGDWFATLEVFDARTGRTSVFLGGPDTVPNPQTR